jgi:heat shock protein HtpX
MPAVYVINENQPNAFATGRNPEHAAVAATVGIMKLLTHEELRGVMAHELAHIKHRDTLISTVSASLAGAIAALANFAMMFGGRSHQEGERSNPIVTMLVMILAPMAASVIQMAVSRAREFEADKGGALISGDPLSLARALAKIEQHASQPFPVAAQHPETAQMMIINPLGSVGKKSSDLFRTHPKTAERIAKLEAMARGVNA